MDNYHKYLAYTNLHKYVQFQAMDIVKSLELRRKSSSKRQDFDDPGEGKSTSTETLDKNILQLKRQYIFIPHTSLDKFDYVKNDVMFLEIVVNQ